MVRFYKTYWKISEMGVLTLVKLNEQSSRTSEGRVAVICGLVANDFSGIDSCFEMIENPNHLKSNIIYDFVPIANPSGKWRIVGRAGLRGCGWWRTDKLNGIQATITLWKLTEVGQRQETWMINAKGYFWTEISILILIKAQVRFNHLAFLLAEGVTFKVKTCKHQFEKPFKLPVRMGNMVERLPKVKTKAQI